MTVALTLNQCGGTISIGAENSHRIANGCRDDHLAVLGPVSATGVRGHKAARRSNNSAVGQASRLDCLFSAPVTREPDMLSPAELTFRKTGIGGSDAAAALGISPWASPCDLWLEKTSPHAAPLLDNRFMYWGRLLEPLLIEEYSRRTGFEVEPLRGIRSNKYRWMLGNLDGRIKGEPRLLEIKTAGSATGWGEPGSDEIPLHYGVQVHHYLTLTGFEVADVGVLIGGNDFRLYRVERDKLVSEELIEEEHAFWRLVETREPPEPANLRDAVARWGKTARRGIVLAHDVHLTAIDELRAIAHQQEELSKREEQAKAIVIGALADRGDLLVGPDGKVLASWKLDNGRRGYEVKPREPGRRFILKGM